MKRMSTIALACLLVCAACSTTKDSEDRSESVPAASQATAGGSATVDGPPDAVPDDADATPAEADPDAESDENDDNAADDQTTQTSDETSPEMTEKPDANAPADVAGIPDDAEVTASGLAYRILKEGEGETTPTPTNTVRVHYTGWTTDGVKFDSSRDRGKPAEFPLNRVIKGWTEGVSMMRVGESRRLWIPAELAYGNRPGRPQGMLVFDVELLAIVK
jgi:peptidylprolyl isomerase